MSETTIPVEGVAASVQNADASWTITYHFVSAKGTLGVTQFRAPPMTPGVAATPAQAAKPATETTPSVPAAAARPAVPAVPYPDAASALAAISAQVAAKRAAWLAANPTF